METRLAIWLGDVKSYLRFTIAMNWFKRIQRALTKPSQCPKPFMNESLNDYTPRSQQVLALARKEADRLHHNFVGAEHLLLGLIALASGTAVNVLGKMGLDLETVRLEVEKQVCPPNLRLRKPQPSRLPSAMMCIVPSEIMISLCTAMSRSKVCEGYLARRATQ